MSNTITKEEIKNFFHIESPCLLIDKLINIVPLKSATAIVKSKKEIFILMDIFQDNQ